MEIPKKEHIHYDWYFIIYQDQNKKYMLAIAYNQSSYMNQKNMIKSCGKIIAIKEGTKKEDKVSVDELIKKANGRRIMNLETELLNLGFTLPR